MPRPVVSAGRIILALDTPVADRARQLAQATAAHVGMIKLGLEFFLASGCEGYAQVAQSACRPVFLDLKLHDIPNTVAGAVRSVLPLAPALLTVHAAGGAAMIEAARRAAEEAGATRPLLLAVTVLTSLAGADLSAIGVSGSAVQQVVRLGRLALRAGADGLVCSALEIAPLRDAFGSDPVLVAPGIRPDGISASDQARTMTPREAIEAGADWLVIGRPITAAPDPAAAAASIAASIA